MRFYRKHFALARDNGCAEPGANSGGIKRGAHDKQTKVWPEYCLSIQRQRQTQYCSGNLVAVKPVFGACFKKYGGGNMQEIARYQPG